MTTDDRRLRSILESVLFAMGEPVPLAKLVALVGEADRKDVRRALEELAAGYERDERGIRLQEVAGGYQLRTAPAHAEYVRKALEQRPARLSRVALETLAIVAYRQPVTRGEVEAIRGVNDAGAVLSTLLERNLIRIAGRKETPGRPLLYGTTAEFLEIFGLDDLSSLPTLRELGESTNALERLAAHAADVVEPSEGPAAVEEAEPDTSHGTSGS